MNRNHGVNKFDAVSKDAETRKVGEYHPNPLGKELALAISSFAKDISATANKQDGTTIKVKLGEIKASAASAMSRSVIRSSPTSR